MSQLLWTLSEYCQWLKTFQKYYLLTMRSKIKIHLGLFRLITQQIKLITRKPIVPTTQSISPQIKPINQSVTAGWFHLLLRAIRWRLQYRVADNHHVWLSVGRIIHSVRGTCQVTEIVSVVMARLMTAIWFSSRERAAVLQTALTLLY